MASLYGGAAPPSDLPALLTDMILGACLKRSRQLEAQQEQELEAWTPGGAAPRPVHFQHDSTWSLTISQKLIERSPRNFRRGTVARKRRVKSNVALDFTLRFRATVPLLKFRGDRSISF